jgi:MoaA/NifB/PqqE/SkfB family radical SAM enzyme
VGLLSIETGYSCNSRCVFCHQVAYRQTPGATIDLTTAEIKAKIAWGARNGYDEIGFSGGEVTIRPDAIDIVAYARQQGFQRIGLTTNGRMLAYPAFALKLVAAGVTSVNFSIHGHTAALHDMLVYSPGSFDQAMAGLDNLFAAATRLKRRVDVMSMSLATPMNVDHFPDIVRLLGAKGIRLHMLQPFIVNEDSVEASDRFMVGYDRIEAAVRAGIEAARAHDGRVKLYNIPPCLLRDVTEGIDHQSYSFDVFSKHDQKAADEANHVPWGFYRIPECRGCKDAWICPGFRREYYPEDRLLDECGVALRGAGDDGEVWLGGTELLSDEGLKSLIRQTRAEGAKRVALLTGGSHRLAKVLYSLAEEEGVDEVIFVAHWQDPRAQDPRILERGNAARLKTGLDRALAISRSGPLKLGLTFGLQDLLAPEAMTEFRALRSAGIARFYVGISYAHHHVDPVTHSTRPAELARGLELLSVLMSEGGDFTFIDHDAPPGTEAPAATRTTLTQLLPRRNGTRLVARTPLAGVEYYFITWSIPHWAIVPVTPDTPAPEASTAPLIPLRIQETQAASR